MKFKHASTKKTMSVLLIIASVLVAHPLIATEKVQEKLVNLQQKDKSFQYEDKNHRQISVELTSYALSEYLSITNFAMNNRMLHDMCPAIEQALHDFAIMLEAEGSLVVQDAFKLLGANIRYYMKGITPGILKRHHVRKVKRCFDMFTRILREHQQPTSEHRSSLVHYYEEIKTVIDDTVLNEELISLNGWRDQAQDLKEFVVDDARVWAPLSILGAGAVVGLGMLVKRVLFGGSSQK